MRFRSPAKYSSWLVALIAVMDSAALWLALSPGRAPATEARLALRMGFSALRSIGRRSACPSTTTRIPTAPCSSPTRST